MLLKNAQELKNTYTTVMANIYLAEAYSVNNWHDKALARLDVALETLENEKDESTRTILTRANVLTSFADVYLKKDEPRKAVEKLQQVIKSYDALEDPESVRQYQYLNYSNIAIAYLSFNLDFAEYYALESIALMPDNVNNDDRVTMMNYFTLGKVNLERQNHQKALDYFHNALDLHEQSGGELRIKEIYSGLVSLYDTLGKKDSAIVYKNKLQEYEISILQSKYNSLREVMEVEQEKKKESNSSSNLWWILTSIVGLVIVVVIIFFGYKRRENQNLSEDKQWQSQYKSLIDLAKNNDPAFIPTFEKVYPDFSKKLLDINPGLSNSEIEFCALLKLNISTKNIAKWTFIEVRTVQNKKYRIRKRLNIPTNHDLYNWFKSV
ncbi:tetratricopeptide repeat protein [Halocola ammonii]